MYYGMLLMVLIIKNIYFVLPLPENSSCQCYFVPVLILVKRFVNMKAVNFEILAFKLIFPINKEILIFGTYELIGLYTITCDLSLCIQYGQLILIYTDYR